MDFLGASPQIEGLKPYPKPGPEPPLCSLVGYCTTVIVQLQWVRQNTLKANVAELAKPAKLFKRRDSLDIVVANTHPSWT